MEKSFSVDEFILNNTKYKTELLLLREIFLATDCTEQLKWGFPTYSEGKTNIGAIGAFKEYVAIWFFQGALLSDPEHVLINAQDDVTKALRQWRFTNADQIVEYAESIQQYIFEAKENANKGLAIKPNLNKPVIIPIELQQVLDADFHLNQSFLKISDARRREFAEYIIAAKRPDTKAKRLDIIVSMILSNTGLYDKYKK